MSTLSPPAATLLDELLSEGVRLKAVLDRLRYDAPRGVLTAGRLERLRAHKSEFLTLLNASAIVHASGPTSAEIRVVAAIYRCDNPNRRRVVARLLPIFRCEP